MTPHDIEQMKADREAGTPGPWRPGHDGVLAIGSVDTASCAVLGRIATAHETDGVDSDGRHWSTSGSAYANARRIARVPDMEAEILRLREALGEARIDLMLCADNARDAAKTDPRWEGVAEKLMARVAECDKALNGDAP